MPYSDRELVDILIGILVGGRGGGVNPENPNLGVPSFLEALASDRQRNVDRMNRSAPRGRTRSQRRLLSALEPRAKPKRKVSAYQREFGRQLKRLKKKHPRTPVTRLMKRAHTATKKARRGK